MTDLDLDALEVESGPISDGHRPIRYSFEAWEVRALITRLREAEAVIESLEALLPKWRESRAYNAEVFTTGGIGMMREIDYHGDVERTLATYKPTNQEGEQNDG